MVKRRLFGNIWAIVFLAVALGIVFYFYQQFYGGDKFSPGIKVAGIPVQGFTVDEAADKLDIYLEQAFTTPIVFYADDYEFKTALGDICQHPDPNQTMQDILGQTRGQNLWGKIRGSTQGLNYPLPIQYDQKVKERLLSEWNERLGISAANAYIEIKPKEGLVIVPEIIGKTVDIKASYAGLPAYWEELAPAWSEIVILKQYPELLAEHLQTMGELSSYSTWYQISEVNRTHNLSKSAALINGCVLQPGQIFSYNNRVGPRTLETGFRDAPVIVGSTMEPGLGGGICQVSSTLYNAVLSAGLEIVERHNHGLAVSYVPLGLDATVAYGFLDFRFRNNTDYPIYISSAAGAGKLQINVYGHLDYKQKAITNYIVDQVIPFEYIEKIDDTMPSGESRVDHKGFNGYIVRSFRTFYDGNDQVLRSELLARDTYKPFNEIVYVGSGELLDPDPSLDDTGEDDELSDDDAPDNDAGEATPPGYEPPADINNGHGAGNNNGQLEI